MRSTSRQTVRLHADRRPLHHLGLLAALVGAALGCRSATAGRGGGAPRTTVAFVNQGLEQANVYAIGTSGEWYRLGTVAGGQTARLRLPASLVATGQTVSIAARPLATSRIATSGPVTIRPGDALTVTLPMSQNVLSVLPGLP